MKINQFTQFWLDNIVALECKSSTIRSYSSICFNHINPLLGTKLLTSLTYKDGVDFRMNLKARDLGFSTINKILNCFKILINKAVELKYLEDNPLTSLKFIKGDKREIRPLDLHQIMRFKGSHVHFKPFYLVALYTGMRLGEIASMRHIDVSKSEFYILVRGTKSGDNIGSTKSSKMRKVPITKECMKIIESILIPGSHDLIWDIDVNNFTNHYLRRDCKELGLEPIRFHDFRHTFATHYIKNGGNIVHLSKILGHSSVNITMDIYVDVNVKDLINDVNSFSLGW